MSLYNSIRNLVENYHSEIDRVLFLREINKNSDLIELYLEEIRFVRYMYSNEIDKEFSRRLSAENDEFLVAFAKFVHTRKRIFDDELDEFTHKMKVREEFLERIRVTEVSHLADLIQFQHNTSHFLEFVLENISPKVDYLDTEKSLKDRLRVFLCTKEAYEEWNKGNNLSATQRAENVAFLAVQKGVVQHNNKYIKDIIRVSYRMNNGSDNVFSDKEKVKETIYLMNNKYQLEPNDFVMRMVNS